MQSKKIYLAVPITGGSVGDMGAVSIALFAREELVKQGYLVKMLCFREYEELVAGVEAYQPRLAAVIEGSVGKSDLEVYHQVLPDWDRYKQSYMMASSMICHTTRLRKMHNRSVHAGYAMQWLQMLNASAMYVRLSMERLDMDEMYMQGRAIALGLMS